MSPNRNGDQAAAAALAAAVADRSYWEPEAATGADRDSRVVARAGAAGATREAMAPAHAAGRAQSFGGGLCRLTNGGVGHPERRDDPHYHAPRYVPIGFAAYHSPVVDPASFVYYTVAGFRVAVPRSLPEPGVRDLLVRIYNYGPDSAGYVRLGDTLVPAALGRSDRQTLVQTPSRYGSYYQKYTNY